MLELKLERNIETGVDIRLVFFIELTFDLVKEREKVCVGFSLCDCEYNRAIVHDSRRGNILLLLSLLLLLLLLYIH